MAYRSFLTLTFGDPPDDGHDLLDRDLRDEGLAGLERFDEALAVVERDLRAQGLPGEVKFIVPAFWEGRVGFPCYTGERHGNGVELQVDWDPVALLVAMADSLQEGVAETWQVWPLCPLHGLGLHAETHERQPVWWCKLAGGHVAGEIGRLTR
jgi:hypothetical protein